MKLRQLYFVMHISHLNLAHFSPQSHVKLCFCLCIARHLNPSLRPSSSPWSYGANQTSLITIFYISTSSSSTYNKSYTREQKNFILPVLTSQGKRVHKICTNRSSIQQPKLNRNPSWERRMSGGYSKRDI
jgi:hypothetical protein